VAAKVRRPAGEPSGKQIEAPRKSFTVSVAEDPAELEAAALWISAASGEPALLRDDGQVARLTVLAVRLRCCGGILGVEDSRRIVVVHARACRFFGRRWPT
jgi:hypothetical protein